MLPTNCAFVLALIAIIVAAPRCAALLSQPTFQEIQPQGQTMPPRYCHSGIILSRWSLGIFYGGRTKDQFLADLWTFSLVSHEWTLRVPITFTGLPPPGLCWSCLSVWDEAASSSLLMGGLDSSGRPSSGTWLLTYKQPTPYWQQMALIGSVPPPRFGHACARVPGNRIATMIYGGFDGKDGVLNDVWILDSNFVWRQLPSVHPSRPPALAHAAIYLGNDIMIIYGGVDTTMSISSGTYAAYVGISDESLFTNPAPLNWSTYACGGTPPAVPSFGFAYATNSKSLMIFGGESSVHPADPSSSSLFVYNLDTATKRWIVTRPSGYPSQRSHHVLLFDQCSETLLVFGGRNADGLVFPTDSLNFPSNSWQRLSVPVLAPPPRTFHVLVAFLEAIIVHGGIDPNLAPRDSVFRDTWRFSLSDQIWTQLSPAAGLTSQPYRAFHAAVRTGQFMMVSGGVDNNFIAQSSTLFLNSVTGEWLSVAQSSSLPTIHNHTMDVLFENGYSNELHGSSSGTLRVVAFGGSQGGSLSNRAWITSVFLHPNNGRSSTDYMLSFDGSTDYLVASDFINLGGEFTIAFWMKSAGFQGYNQAVMSIGQIGMGIQIVQCSNTGTMCFYCEGSKMLSGRTKVNDGSWHYVAVSLSVSLRVMSIYIDGSLDATRSDTYLAPKLGSFEFNIGRGGLQTVSHFLGAIDDVRIWQIAARVSSSFEVPAQPVAFWNFDNAGAPFLQQNMFPSVLQNYIMYCGGSFGHCPTVVLSSAPVNPGAHQTLKSDGWVALPLVENSLEPPARHSHAAAAVNGHMLLVHGGIGFDGSILSDLWLGVIVQGKLISWSQLFQPQTFGLYAHSLISHFDQSNQELNQIVTVLSRDSDSLCNIDFGSCRSFSVSANFMESCPSLCTVPIMHGTRADITFQNDIYGFGGSAGSSVAQNNMWSFQSDGTWRKVIASSPQSHPRTSWPQMVLSIDPVTGMWDGDTLICVGSNDVPQINSAGYLTVMQYSTSLRMWSSISNTQVLNPPTARRGHLLASYHGSFYPGQLVVFGGNDGNIFYNQTYILNPHARVSNLKFYNWTSIAHASAIAPPPMSHASGFVYNNTLWIYGGLAAGNIVQGTLWSFSFVTHYWSSHLHSASNGPKPCYGCNLVFIDAASSIRAYLVFGISDVPAVGSLSNEQEDANLSPSTFLLTIGPLSSNSYQINWNAVLMTNTPGASPPLRHHASAAIFGKTLVLYGGFDKYRKPLDDFWILGDGATWVQLKQPKGPPARGFACMLPVVALNGIYIFAGSSDFSGFSPLKDLWFVSVSSSSPSSFIVATPSLSVAYAGELATFSLVATDFFLQKKDSLFCYEDLVLQLTSDYSSIQGMISFDSTMSNSYGGCVYQGSYVPSAANLYQITVKIYGLVINGFPKTVNVKASNPDPDFSGLIFPSENGPCDGLSTDESTAFIIRTFDRNGNPGMSPSQFSIEGYLLPDPFWYPLLDQNDESNWLFSTSLQTNIKDSYNGFFQVTLSNTRSGNYSVSVLLEGKPVSGSPFICSVDTGNVEPSLLKINPITVFTVGASSSFVMQTVDQFGNNISTAPGVAGDVVTAQLLGDITAEAAVLEGDRGQWTMNVHPKVVGRSRLVVVVNDLVVFSEDVNVEALMQPVVFGPSWFHAINGIPASMIIIAFTIGSLLHYKAILAQQATTLKGLGEIVAPPEAVAETFDDIDKIHLDPDWLKADETCQELRKIGANHDAQDDPGRRLIYMQMIEVLTALGDKLGLSLDEGAVLSDSMLDDAAVQAVFATFISGDGGGKEGLEELQTRLRRISTCAQFSSATPRDLDEFQMGDDLDGIAATEDNGGAPDSARANAEDDIGARIRRGSVFDIDV